MTLLCAAVALAQQVSPDRDEVPGATVAGAHAAWSPLLSPALAAFDRDPRLGLVVHTDGTGAIALGRGGFGLGGSWVDPDGDGTVEGSVDGHVAFRMDDVALGTTLVTHVPGGEAAYATALFGAAWRPVAVFGLAGAMQTGAPGHAAAGRTATSGLALRTPDGGLLFGTDVRWDLDAETVALRPALHLRTLRGVDLFGQASIDPEAGTLDSLAVGATLGVANLALGGALRDVGGTLAGSVLVHDDDPDRSLIRPDVTADIHLERTPPYEARRALFGRDETPTWSETLATVHRAATDRTRKRLVLRLDGAALGWARAEELRDAVVAVVAAGKDVTAWLGPNVGTASYWVATAATDVAMDPAGQLDLTGGSIDLVHLRGLLDRIGVEAQMVRRSEYKSAPEQMSLNEPTAEALEQIEVLLDDVFDHVVADVAEAREQAAETVARWIDEGPWDASEALEAGLVDRLIFPDELLSGPRPEVVGTLLAGEHDTGWPTGRAIALIHIEGAIVDGGSGGGGFFGPRTTGSDTVVQQLETALHTDRIRAVVLRVDSPGGSATASDAIWRAVTRVSQKKPVVVSMGGVAASGGYYVACGADAIWAEPSTITGSIGVFTTKLSAGGLFDKVGITSTVVQRGRNADLDSTSHAWNDDQRSKMQSLVDAIYARFKARVAEGRALGETAVEEAARGRVWSGTRAKDVGLVDELGGLHEAILDAASRAGLSDRRAPSLVSLRGNGELLDLLGPGARTDLQRLDALLTPLDPLLLVAAHPEVGVWALDPAWMDEGPR